MGLAVCQPAAPFFSYTYTATIGLETIDMEDEKMISSRRMRGRSGMKRVGLVVRGCRYSLPRDSVGMGPI